MEVPPSPQGQGGATLTGHSEAQAKGTRLPCGSPQPAVPREAVQTPEPPASFLDSAAGEVWIRASGCKECQARFDYNFYFGKTFIKTCISN